MKEIQQKTNATFNRMIFGRKAVDGAWGALRRR
jgi:hypothetical protein